MLPFFISIIVIVFTAIALYKHLNPQGTLITAGIIMLMMSLLIDCGPLPVKSHTGSIYFDVIKIIEETFISNISRAGLMIMTIGGYVAFMNNIKATNTLVRITIKPLNLFKRCPMVAAMLTIPLGQMLFITTPSATGIGLLLVASVYPILTNLGVSKLTALSVISATTLFDQGPGSANTALAAELIHENNLQYFITHQLPLVIPTTLIVIVTFYIFNRYFDNKEKKNIKMGNNESVVTTDDMGKKAPSFFALLPVLPLIILIVFSPYVNLLPFSLTVNTTTAMILSLFVSLICVLIHNRSLVKTFTAFSSFWKGMGSVFGSVVTLIVASEIFSKGLIQLTFVDSLISYSVHIGLTGIMIAIVFTLIIFCAAILMGSGNAAFFSFGPLLPNISSQLGLPAFSIVLPMQLAASMGRAASPIAGVIVAISGIVGVSPLDLAKRNLFPLIISIVFLIFYHFITL